MMPKSWLNMDRQTSAVTKAAGRTGGSAATATDPFSLIRSSLNSRASRSPSRNVASTVNNEKKMFQTRILKKPERSVGSVSALV